MLDKIYNKEHTNPKITAIHQQKIAKRGGKMKTETGQEKDKITYSFDGDILDDTATVTPTKKRAKSTKKATKTRTTKTSTRRVIEDKPLIQKTVTKQTNANDINPLSVIAGLIIVGIGIYAHINR